MSINSIIASFQKLGYKPKNKITYNTFTQILDQLLTYKFDPVIANQLWQQANIDQNQQALVQELCQIIGKARDILNEKIKQINQMMVDLTNQKKQIENDNSVRPQQKINEIKKIIQQMEQLKKDKNQYSEDLKLVTIPFNIGNSVQQPIKSARHSQQKYKKSSNLKTPRQQVVVHQKQQKFIGSPNDQFKWILWISIIIFLIQIILSFSKFNNLNLIVSNILLSIFLLNYFDTFYMKLSLAFTSLSFILDIFWCILYTSSYWSPPLTGVHSQNQVGFLRFIVFFTIVGIIFKFPLIILIYRNKIILRQTNYNIIIFGKYIINLSGGNQLNLISASINKNTEVDNNNI